jgi:hypothetical protein
MGIPFNSVELCAYSLRVALSCVSALMSARRDNSQGHGFVYVDLNALLRGAKAPEHSITCAKPLPNKLQDNLERLRALHHKLHAILSDLEARHSKKKGD